MNDLIPFSDLEKMAVVLGKNKMFGKTPDELLPLLLIAQAEGKHPAIAAQDYDIIQGKPALRAVAALSRFQLSGGKIQWIERTDTKVSAKFSHAMAGDLTITWDMARAGNAGLTNKPTWKQYPTQMLSARVIAEGVRALYPACLNGMYLTEEVQDFDATPRNVTPEKPAQQIAPEVIDVHPLSIGKPQVMPEPIDLVDNFSKDFIFYGLEIKKAVINWTQAQRDSLSLRKIMELCKSENNIKIAHVLLKKCEIANTVLNTDKWIDTTYALSKIEPTNESGLELFFNEPASQLDIF